jgi:uncharacterized protein (TIGR03435 family)
VVFAGTVLEVVALRGQSVQGPRFEVASIRRNTSGSIQGSMSVSPGGDVSGTNVTLRALISAASGGIPTSRILGGPAWVDRDRYDVLAKAEGEPPEQEVRLMLAALLRERFNLVSRMERREFPAYALVRARPNGPLGPRLRPAAVNCDDSEARAKAALDTRDRPPCGVRQRAGSIVAGGVRLTQITGYFGAGRPVLERTGLSDRFDVDLEWAPTPDGDGVSIFTALQEQLGLKLENTTAPLPVIIIERVERPTEN